jgi:hypothetical protein
MEIPATDDLSEEFNAFAVHAMRNEAQIGEIERRRDATGRYLERTVTKLGRPILPCPS